MSRPSLKTGVNSFIGQPAAGACALVFGFRLQLAAKHVNSVGSPTQAHEDAPELQADAVPYAAGLATWAQQGLQTDFASDLKRPRNLS